MGVTGLWRLIEPTGKPVPVETLENKVLAVDISIWLHQMVKGYQDAKGAPLPNAHLMGLFQRLCKLLYFRVKPVFVFDGAFPELKKETIAKRQDNKSRYHSESERLKRELALLLSKQTAISSLLGKQLSPKKAVRPETSNDDDIFKLPALPEKKESESESEDEDTSSGSIIDVHSVDLESEHFKSLPVKEKYDVLIELKETRKMNSWGKLHELPKKSDNFSSFQMERLLKRRKVQECLIETEKEMGSCGMSLNELESLLNEEGIDTKIESLPTRRIASSDTDRFLLISNVKQALADAKNRELKQVANNKELEPGPSKSDKPKDELQEDTEKAIKMSLEDKPSDVSTARTDDSWSTLLSDSDYDDTDSEENDGYEAPVVSSAKAYIMQYSDFTGKAIDDMISKRVSAKIKQKKCNADAIVEELNAEKTVVADNINLSSDEDVRDVQINDTNMSVAFVPNTQNEVITLDTTADSENNTNLQDIEEEDEELQRAIQMSLECDNVQDEVPKTESIELKQDVKTKEESDSDSSDDFEEVPTKDEIKSKPVVELTLTVAEELEEDIFADVFDTPKEVNINITKIKTEPSFSDHEDEFESIIDNEHEESIVDASIEEPKSPETQTNESIPTPAEGAKHNRIKVIKPNEDTQNNDSKNEPVHEFKEQKTPTAVEKQTNEPLKEKLSTEALNSMANDIQNEADHLIQEKGRLDRIGRNITEQMTKEAQELLQIFGIPYIVAPMEAEAQCAFLESVKLTDGTITDDSDIWLFGGRTVYKNFFNQKKHVLQFVSERIEKSFNLSREQLILLAILVGSDYTTGVSGVGPVTALEILASFPFNKKLINDDIPKQEKYAKLVSGLQDFKKWVRSGKRTDNTTLKKKLRNVDVNEDFPSVRVVQAYLEPNVEKSEAKFTWGHLDITVLRDYARAKFGWSQHKLDEIMKPVIKRLEDRNTQKTLQNYFNRKVEFQNLEEQMSKRVKAAVQRMGPDGSTVQIEEPTKPPTKRKITKKTKETAEGTEKTTSKRKKKELPSTVIKVESVNPVEQKAAIEVKITKTDRFQEIIPQREKEKQSLLQNKMKAIEVFRKTKIDPKHQIRKRRAQLLKDKADLSESDSD